MNSDNDASHAAAEKFIRLHPRHPNIDYAYFMKGLSSYTRDNSLMQRLTELIYQIEMFLVQNNLFLN